MRLWIDADNFPTLARDLVFRAAVRTQIVALAVSNKVLRLNSWVHTALDYSGQSPVPLSDIDNPNLPSPIIALQVAAGIDLADDWIALNAQACDLVFTRDLVLAARLLALGVQTINDRGELWNRISLESRIKQSNFAQELRSMGVASSSTAASYNKVNLKAFAATFDREFQRRLALLERQKKTDLNPSDP